MRSRPGKASEHGMTIRPAGRHARIAFSLDFSTSSSPWELATMTS
jgi:hypothetical protein